MKQILVSLPPRDLDAILWAIEKTAKHEEYLVELGAVFGRSRVARKRDAKRLREILKDIANQRKAQS